MSTSESLPTVVSFGEDVLERMVCAARLVQYRMDRSTSALEKAAIPYAIGGSNAAAIWIGSIDVSALATRLQELLDNPDD